MMTEPGGAVDALVELRDAGEIGHIGVAGGDTREISRYVDLGVFEAVLVHNRWTLVDRSAGPLFEQASGGRHGSGQCGRLRRRSADRLAAATATTPTARPVPRSAKRPRR